MNFEKYHKIKAYGDEDNKDILLYDKDIIHIEEKIDGANFRLLKTKEGKILFGSRSQDVTEAKGKQWTVAVDWLKENVNWKKIKKDHIYYMEFCIRHSIRYDWETIPKLLGFDIKKDEGYLNYKTKTKLFKQLGIEMVPLVKEITAKELREVKNFDDLIPESKYKKGAAEGVVIKNYKRGLFAKVVSDKFKEENVKAFGGSKKWMTDTDDKIVAQYCTNGRIEKWIHKIKDDGIKLEMAMMKYLPTAVFDDVIEEHIKEIIKSYKRVDFQYVRKRITGRCLSVLKQQIMYEVVKDKKNGESKQKKTKAREKKERNRRRLPKRK